MEKAIIPVIIFLLILASAISILSFKIFEKDNWIETHSYTTAICNSTNFCQDNMIKCNKNQVISISPITGAAVQFSIDWQDSRDEQEINGFCG